MDCLNRSAHHGLAVLLTDDDATPAVLRATWAAGRVAVLDGEVQALATQRVLHLAADGYTLAVRLVTEQVNSTVPFA